MYHDDIVFNVFSYLNGSEISDFREVSKQWRRVVLDFDQTLPLHVTEHSVLIIPVFNKVRFYVSCGSKTLKIKFEELSFHRIMLIQLAIFIRHNQRDQTYGTVLRMLEQIADFNHGVIHVQKLELYAGVEPLFLLKPNLMDMFHVTNQVRSFGADDILTYLIPHVEKFHIESMLMNRNSKKSITEGLVETNVRVEQLVEFMLSSNVGPHLDLLIKDEYLGLMERFCETFAALPNGIDRTIKLATSRESTSVEWVNYLSRYFEGPFDEEGNFGDRFVRLFRHHVLRRRESHAVDVVFEKEFSNGGELHIYRRQYQWEIFAYSIDNVLPPPSPSPLPLFGFVYGMLPRFLKNRVMLMLSGRR